MSVHYSMATNYRIGWGTAAVLIITAGMFDLVGAIPIIGSITGPVYWVSLSAFLFTKGFGLINARRLVTSLISLVIEVIPAVQALPAILAGTVAIIIFARIEDRTGLSLHKKGVVDSGSVRNALNQQGRREPLPEKEPVENLAALTGKMNLRPLNMDGIRQPQPDNRV